ncbi:hypothetical protein DY037_05695 [Apilactobacillus micheneri]|uniref:hypothetical protein n=1 Tax=Apilactobacillus micheneri TaxID=1899430 RepID=UPI00112C1139|nr:hypothetical protein [Apilactobacillus micheneri]TPR49275.1 hypothetical protein DY037_05695 [Apilactobacillus micheneri]
MNYHLLVFISLVAGTIAFIIIKKGLKYMANMYPKKLGLFSSSEDVIYIFLINKNKQQLRSLINNYSFWNKLSFHIIEFGALISASIFLIMFYILSSVYIGYSILITGLVNILLMGIYNNFIRVNTQNTLKKYFDSKSFNPKK